MKIAEIRITEAIWPEDRADRALDARIHRSARGRHQINGVKVGLAHAVLHRPF
jgi:hypothetical protein